LPGTHNQESFTEPHAKERDEVMQRSQDGVLYMALKDLVMKGKTETVDAYEEI
jgi:hypothetical protein